MKTLKVYGTWTLSTSCTSAGQISDEGNENCGSWILQIVKVKKPASTTINEQLSPHAVIA